MAEIEAVLGAREQNMVIVQPVVGGVVALGVVVFVVAQSQHANALSLFSDKFHGCFSLSFLCPRDYHAFLSRRYMLMIAHLMFFVNHIIKKVPKRE
jgi:phosphatidylserine decarboxylase